MDLISREELKDYLEKNISFGGTEKKFRFYDMIDSLPSAFEGMTNGDVLKAIFPDCIDYHGIVEVKTHLDMGNTFRRSWWDAPYKGQDGLI